MRRISFSGARKVEHRALSNFKVIRVVQILTLRRPEDVNKTVFHRFLESVIIPHFARCSNRLDELQASPEHLHGTGVVLKRTRDVSCYAMLGIIAPHMCNVGSMQMVDTSAPSSTTSLCLIDAIEKGGRDVLQY